MQIDKNINSQTSEFLRFRSPLLKNTVGNRVILKESKKTTVKANEEPGFKSKIPTAVEPGVWMNTNNHKSFTETVHFTTNAHF